MFRVGRTARDIARPEILLIRRAPGRILPGLWQCVSGSLEDREMHFDQHGATFGTPERAREALEHVFLELTAGKDAIR